jgi:polysaccharide export outer membrane protein
MLKSYLNSKSAQHEPREWCLSVSVFAILLFVVSLIFSSLTLVANAQTRTSSGATPPPAPTSQPVGAPFNSVLVEPNEDYRLAPGDTIEVFIEDAAELSQAQIRLTAAGTFEMPFLGLINAQGKTTLELARFIAGNLREQDYLKQPQVRVSVKQYSGQIFFIQGAVRSPGLYQLEGRPYLLRLIGLAGGLIENSGPTAIILRQSKPVNRKDAALAAADPSDDNGKADDKADNSEPEDIEVIKVALSSLVNQGRTDQNIRLEPGDIVNIPPAKVFFVAGEVHAPGSFQMKEGTTLRQAISLAQGMTFKAAQKRAVIYRDDPETNKRQEISVDIGAVMNGKKEDIAVYPNDIIIVPNSRIKSISSALLSAFGTSAARVPMRY